MRSSARVSPEVVPASFAGDALVRLETHAGRLAVAPACIGEGAANLGGGLGEEAAKPHRIKYKALK